MKNKKKNNNKSKEYQVTRTEKTIIFFLLIAIIILVYLILIRFGYIENIGTGKIDHDIIDITTCGSKCKTETTTVSPEIDDTTTSSTTISEESSTSNKNTTKKVTTKKSTYKTTTRTSTTKKSTTAKKTTTLKSTTTSSKKTTSTSKPTTTKTTSTSITTKLNFIVNDDYKIYDSKELRIFENPDFNYESIIAPGDENSYTFVIRNQNSFDIIADINMSESNSYGFNLKYKLRSEGKYLAGSSSKYVDVDDLSVKGILIPANSSKTYTLDWKWIDSDHDTSVGINDDANYQLFINIGANAA